MVSLPPIADIVSPTFLPKLTENGIAQFTDEKPNQEIFVDTIEVVSSKPDSDDLLS